MIERYSRPEASAIWNLENKYTQWLRVELAAADVLAGSGQIPKAEVDEVRRKAKIDPARIATIELEVKHDVIAFLTSIEEQVGESSRFLHYGMTSSDVLDTGFALQMTQALDLVVAGVDRLGKALKKRAHEFKDTLQMGRSHGIHAEPVTFGLKLTLFFDELSRNRRRLLAARKGIAVGKFSGAVGTYAHLPPSVEEAACKALSLTPETTANQVIQRDRHAEVFTALAILGGTLEKISVEVRHLQRTEVGEAEEPFTRGQKGSSAMPHKRNPIATENITGCARLLRSYAQAALEDIALWHERDISHSSVERVIGPDATILADYMLHRLTAVIENLVVYPDRMQRNLESSRGLIFSQALLLKLVEAGLKRQEAYVLVQQNAMRVWDEGLQFEDLVRKDDRITKKLDRKTLDALFDPMHYVKHRDEVMRRVFERERDWA